jgi:hypothetical protein
MCDRIEPRLDDLLADPIFLDLWRADRIDERDVRYAINRAQRALLSDADVAVD